MKATTSSLSSFDFIDWLSCKDREWFFAYPSFYGPVYIVYIFGSFFGTFTQWLYLPLYIYIYIYIYIYMERERERERERELHYFKMHPKVMPQATLNKLDEHNNKKMEGIPFLVLYPSHFDSLQQ